MRKGIPLAPGVAVARAYRVDQGTGTCTPRRLEASDLPAELSRFERASAAAAQELDATIVRVAGQLGEAQTAIFRAHRALLGDPALADKVKSAILQGGANICSAVQTVLAEYTALFAQVQDAYLKQRLADLRDVIGLILNHLDGREETTSPFPPEEAIILVVPEILPSHVLMFHRLRLAGVLTEAGGGSGHAAILARSLGIPAISELAGILSEVRTGDLVALDAREGHVHINPGFEVETAYRRLQHEYAVWRERLVENRDLEAVTVDGQPVELLANVNGVTDAALAAQVGACGVGLYRTEYLFLTHPGVPDEEEQLTTFQAVVEAAPQRTVTIRTLDVGADKQIPYLGRANEPNPSLGWRSTRLLSAHPEFFQMHLQAILRAGCGGTVSLLVPMISLLEEVQAVKRLRDAARAEVVRRGQACVDHVPVGIMLEVPAAAACIETLLDEVDFVSIGSNDLTQYLMAADRTNPQVAHLCEPFSPALYRVLNRIIQTCIARGKPVTVCGEMAGQPYCLLPLLGMGLRCFSMSPALVPTIKELVRRATLPLAQEVAEQVLRLRTMDEIRAYLVEQTQQLWPEVARLHPGAHRPELPMPATGKAIT
jgi:phosphoenolpyruvate-protein phosphotransferase